MKQEDLDKIKEWIAGGIPIMDIIEYAYKCGQVDALKEAREIVRNKKDVETEQYLRSYYEN